MRITGKAIVLIVMVTVLLTGVPVAAAEDTDHTNHYDLSCFIGWGKYVSNIKWWYKQEGTKDFTDAIITAVNAWNDTPTPINMIRVDTKGESVLRIYSNDYGNTEWYAKFKSFPDYHISINEFYFKSELEWQIIIAHEIGHAHGLDHYNKCKSELMYNSPWRRDDYHPYIGDINGINKKYHRDP